MTRSPKIGHATIVLEAREASTTHLRGPNEPHRRLLVVVLGRLRLLRLLGRVVVMLVVAVLVHVRVAVLVHLRVGRGQTCGGTISGRLHHLERSEVLHVGQLLRSPLLIGGLLLLLLLLGRLLHTAVLAAILLGVDRRGDESLLGLGLVGVGDLEALVHQGIAVEVLDGVNSAEGEAVLDEAVALAGAGLAVADDLDALDGAVHLEELAQLHLIDGGGDVVHHEVANGLRLGAGRRLGRGRGHHRGTLHVA